jgi:predicted esterase
MARWFAALPGLEDGTRAVVAPEALSRFYVEEALGAHGPTSRVGASWMTRWERDSEINDYVRYLDQVHTAFGGERSVVLGFSQGAETASRWVVLGGVRPDQLILWGGGLAVDLDPSELSRSLGETRIRLVVGSEDGWAQRRARETERQLADAGLRPEVVPYAGGHGIDASVLEAVAAG